jgi:glycosyltransferase involved in cell wall biosynthesis
MYSVSFVIPTLNSAKTLNQCLESIKNQNYQGEIEIIIADGGSSDQTVEIAKSYNAKIIKNKLKTGEAGKAVGVKQATKDLICLLDSDNILPNKKWLKKMTKPFNEPKIIGAEPYKFTLDQNDGYIDRYCALMGMNDPLCYFLGNYDHYNYLDQTWHRMPLQTKENQHYWQIKITNPNLPTMGANGAMYRKEFLLNILKDNNYLFDIDILPQAVDQQHQIYYAKVKTSIKHLYSGSNIKRFFRKQRRRQRDMMARRGINDIFIKPDFNQRAYRWDEGSTTKFALKIMIFILSCLTLIPLIYQTYKGYRHKKDSAWLAHPLLCWTTLIAYSYSTIQGLFIKQELDRSKWKQ